MTSWVCIHANGDKPGDHSLHHPVGAPAALEEKRHRAQPRFRTSLTRPLSSAQRRTAPQLPSEEITALSSLRGTGSSAPSEACPSAPLRGNSPQLPPECGVPSSPQRKQPLSSPRGMGSLSSPRGRGSLSSLRGMGSLELPQRHRIPQLPSEETAP